MKKHLMVLSLALLAGVAFAAPGGESDNAGCNGQGNAASPCAGASNAGGAGGAGGNGGAGGTGIGLGVGVGLGGSATGGNATAAGGTSTSTSSSTSAGGSVTSSGNSSSTSTSAGGAGGAGGKGGSATAAGGTATVGNVSTGASTATVGNVSTGASTASVGDATSSSGGNTLSTGTQNVTVQGDTVTHEAPRIPVASAWAPAVNPTAVCALGLSGGAQGVGFGLSLGASYVDRNCELLEQVRAAHNIGEKAVAVEMMCDVASYRAARARMGRPCAGDVKTGESQPARRIGTISAMGQVIQ